jgi:hypothetical protein
VTFERYWNDLFNGQVAAAQARPNGHCFGRCRLHQWMGTIEQEAVSCPRGWGERQGMAIEKMNIRGPTMSTRKVLYENVNTAPIVYFDQTSAHGALDDSIEVELAARALCPNQDATVDVKLITSGRLRCSPLGVRHLTAALIAALKLRERQSQDASAEASKLN